MRITIFIKINNVSLVYCANNPQDQSQPIMTNNDDININDSDIFEEYDKQNQGSELLNYQNVLLNSSVIASHVTKTEITHYNYINEMNLSAIPEATQDMEYSSLPTKMMGANLALYDKYLSKIEEKTQGAQKVERRTNHIPSPLKPQNKDQGHQQEQKTDHPVIKWLLGGAVSVLAILTGTKIYNNKRTNNNNSTKQDKAKYNTFKQ